MSNFKNTISNFKRLLGRPFEDASVQALLPTLPYKLVKHPVTGGVAVEVIYFQLNRLCYAIIIAICLSHSFKTFLGRDQTLQ